MTRLRKINNETLISTVLVAGVVLVAIILVKFPRGKNQVTYFGKTIDKFCINTVCLTKSNQKWVVSNGKISVPADGELAQNYADRIIGLKLIDIVSDNRDNFAIFDIGVSNQTTIIANNKKLEIGSMDSDFTGTYVREEDGSVVYDVKTILNDGNTKNWQYWQQKAITNVLVDDITRVQISAYGITKELAINQNGKWDDTNFINSLAKINTSGYLEDVGATAPTGSVDISLKGSEVKFDFGSSIINKVIRYWVKTGDGYYWEVDKSIFDLLTAKLR